MSLTFHIENLGSFEVTGPFLAVGDPCYSYLDIVESALVGTWVGCLHYEAAESGYTEVFILEATHMSYKEEDGWTRASFPVLVDSGQAGTFNNDSYRREETFYPRACDVTEKGLGGCLSEGVVSRSGPGDGSYVCEIHQNTEGKVDGVRIVFETDDEETLD